MGGQEAWPIARLVPYKRAAHSAIEAGTMYEHEEWLVRPAEDGPAPEGAVEIYGDTFPGWRAARLAQLLQDLMFYHDHRINGHDVDDFRRVWRDCPSNGEHLASLRFELPARARAGRRILFRIGDAVQLALSDSRARAAPAAAQTMPA